MCNALTATSSPFTDRIVRMGEAVRIVGLSRARLYKMSRTNSFPKIQKLNERASGFLLSDIRDWMSARYGRAVELR